jgi:hypothetical protein
MPPSWCLYEFLTLNTHIIFPQRSRAHSRQHPPGTYVAVRPPGVSSQLSKPDDLSSARVKRPRSRHPLLAPARLVPFHTFSRARRSEGSIPRSRSARRDSRRRATVPYVQRRILAVKLAVSPHHQRAPALPRSAHAPIPHRPRSWRHQAHLRAHRVRRHLLSIGVPGPSAHPPLPYSFYFFVTPSDKFATFHLSAILIRTAAIACGRPPEFPVQARGEPETNERVAWSLRHPGKRLEEAMRKEGFDAERAARIWDKWEGGSWRTSRFRQRVPSRL